MKWHWFQLFFTELNHLVSVCVLINENLGQNFFYSMIANAYCKGCLFLLKRSKKNLQTYPQVWIPKICLIKQRYWGFFQMKYCILYYSTIMGYVCGNNLNVRVFKIQYYFVALFLRKTEDWAQKENNAHSGLSCTNAMSWIECIH